MGGSHSFTFTHGGAFDEHLFFKVRLATPSPLMAIISALKVPRIREKDVPGGMVCRAAEMTQSGGRFHEK